jgi:hypothetical protein
VVDAKGNDAGGRTESSPGALESDFAGILRRPPVVGGVAAAVGLIAGILIGRASVDSAPAESYSVNAALARKGPAGEPTGVEKVIPRGPSPWYRLHLGRNLPKSAKGFEPVKDGSRRVARMASKEATLRFELAEVQPGPYAFTSVVSLEGGNKGALEVYLDGQSLVSFPLLEGWQTYSTPLPEEMLAQHTHELTLRVDGIGEKATVSWDGIAVAPVGSEVSLEMGTQAAGSLVDGFGKPSSTHVWNHGSSSTLGVVLAPAANKDYRLTVRGSTLPRLAPLNVSAKVNETAVGTASFTQHAGTGAWSVPASALRPGLNRVEFRYPATVKASDRRPDSKDNRPLALRFTNVGLAPVP